MADQRRTDSNTVDLDALADLCTPWCLRVAVTLKIPDHIAAGISDVDELARAAGCDAHSLNNVLMHLATKGVFEQTEPRRFALNEPAEALLDPGRRGMLELDGIGGRFSHAWSTMLSAVTTGAPAYHEVFGMPFWEDLDAHPDIAASFDAAMGPAGHGIPNPEILLTGGWDAVKTVVDVGGGTGAMLAEILRAHPHLQGTLLDFPRTVARSADIFEAAGVTDRVATVGQSFFDPLPAGADVYLLKSVLNDWPDAESVRILRRCAEATHPGSRVVVAGGVSPDDATEPVRIGVDMIVVRGLGGKPRTETRFREMAREAGLKVAAAGQPPSGRPRFVVECRPA